MNVFLLTSFYALVSWLSVNAWCMGRKGTIGSVPFFTHVVRVCLLWLLSILCPVEEAVALVLLVAKCYLFLIDSME